MRLALALGVAFTAMTAVAFAQSDRIIIRHHGGPHANVDANNDGWVSRDEASAGADRIFAELDRNDDGRLTDADQPELEEFNVRIPAPGEPVGEGCQTTVDPPNAREGEERRVTVICNGADGRHERRIERHGSNERHEERTVTVVRTGEGGTWTSEDGTVTAVPPVPPIPPVPPMPPMFIMMFGNSESDLNGDGAIDQAEFRAQHLRYFDAADANRDGRVRFDPPPAPPEPPTPPAPPEPPRRR